MTCLKLSVYFGESDRAGSELLSDALVDLFELRRLHAAVLLRGAEGFGLGQTLRSDRFLSLSEDLPLVALAVGEDARVEAAAAEATRLLPGGLVTVERARLVSRALESAPLPEGAHDETKLTLYLGRDERVGRRPAFLAVVDHLRRHGLAGATVVLGVDGISHGERRRAAFFSRNERVPLLVVAVGASRAVAAALPGLGALLRDPLATIERVRVCRRDGRSLAEPDDAAGVWQKLTVYTTESARHEGHPLAVQLVRRLRESGAAGATTVRGIWGFSGEHAPHGDRLLRVRRRVPVVVTVVERPEAIRRLFPLVAAVTAETGLVTCETVPRSYPVAPYPVAPRL